MISFDNGYGTNFTWEPKDGGGANLRDMSGRLVLGLCPGTWARLSREHDMGTEHFWLRDSAGYVNYGSFNGDTLCLRRNPLASVVIAPLVVDWACFIRSLHTALRLSVAAMHVAETVAYYRGQSLA